MSDLEEFEDWSHATRALTLPRRRPRIHWWRVLVALVLCLLLGGAWYMGHIVRDAYRVVFSS